MSSNDTLVVTMRVRVGDSEIEVTGPTEYVEHKIQEFLKKPPVVPSAAPQAPASSPASPAPTAKAQSPAQFFKTCNPKTDTDRVLLAVYYLEKVRNVPNATVVDIRDLIAEARRPSPSNPSECISQNIRKGFLMTAGDREGKMAVVVTSDGEAYCEDKVSAKPA